MKCSKIFNIDIYSCKVQLIVTDDVYTEEKNLYLKNNEEHIDYVPSDGVTLNFANDIYYIIFHDDSISHNLIAHELYHLVSSICDYRSIDEEESRAWLCGYLTQIFYKFLIKKNITIKDGF
jgi:hypothetical protein